MLQLGLLSVAASSKRQRLTLTFSGATSGLTSNHLKCASWPPLQRLVRQPSKGPCYLAARLLRPDATAAPAAGPPHQRLRGGRVCRAVRRRVAPARHYQAGVRLRQRDSLVESGEAGGRSASDVRPQVMTKSPCSHGCLTLHITGPPNGLERNHKNCASAAPVHVVVRWRGMI